jgi:hypothetical protein
MNWRACGRSGRKSKIGRRGSRLQRRCTRASFEALESRRVLATVSFSGGILSVSDAGSSSNDSIVVAAVGSPAQVQVTVNGQVVTDPAHPVVSLSDVTSVDVAGGNGDDTITIKAIDTTVSVDGGTGDNKLVIIGDATANTFANLTGSSLSVNGNAYTFMNLGSLGSLNVVGQGAKDTLSVMTMPTFSVLYNGGGGINTLIGPNTVNTWNILTVNGGNLNPTLISNFRFGNVQNLTGGTASDTFNIFSGGSIGNNITGGGGADLLSYASRSSAVKFSLQANIALPSYVGFGTGVGGLLDVDTIEGSSSGNDTLLGFNGMNTFDITGANAGMVTGIVNATPHVAQFSSFENLTGRDQNDSFVFADGAGVTGKISGGTGNDTMDFSAYTTAVSINLQSKMFLNASAGRFAGIETFIGSTANTTTLIGPNTLNKWSITGTNAGTLNAAGAKFSFSSMANLTGGNVADTFFLFDGGSITGTVNGDGGTDSLDYSKYSTAITVNLQTNTTTGVGTISNIERLIGSMSTDDRLIGANAGSTFRITDNNAGNVGTLNFSKIENLTGGTGGDTFVLANGKGISGKINGGGGTGIDELNYSAFTTPVNVNLTTGTATKIFGGAAAGVTGISDVFGGSANDTLIGNASDNFLFGNGGNDTLDGMGGSNVLVGGAGTDSLTVTGSAGRNLLLGGNGADHLTGGTGNDILFNGTTSFDSDVATLNAIYTFWKGAANFATAVGQLRAGTATGVSIALDATNVFSDSFIDTLTGGSGSNWFLVKLTSPDKDHITDLNVNDAVN